MVADVMFCIIVMLMIYLVEEREAPGGDIPWEGKYGDEDMSDVGRVTFYEMG
ncbi:hypothetical protein IMZ48_21425 [Candidatus Bathyarchaeota archaeon]|nr:hypothetical protein [Candidatus Bathyarchaeota archaeon]